MPLPSFGSCVTFEFGPVLTSSFTSTGMPASQGLSEVSSAPRNVAPAAAAMRATTSWGAARRTATRCPWSWFAVERVQAQTHAPWEDRPRRARLRSPWPRRGPFRSRALHGNNHGDGDRAHEAVLFDLLRGIREAALAFGGLRPRFGDGFSEPNEARLELHTAAAIGSSSRSREQGSEGDEEFGHFASPMIRNSTLRFCSRPAGVLLLARGRVGPKPVAMRRLGETPFLMSTWRIVSARRFDSSMFFFAAPTSSVWP